MREYSVGLAGESYRQPAIAKTQVGEAVSFEPEFDNRYDDRAVKVLNQRGDHIGYLPRDGWLTDYLLDQGGSVAASVCSIGTGTGGHLGVVLKVEK